MLYRYTTALVLMAVMAGACSQSRNESVVPETAASTTTDTAASTTIGGAVSTTVDAAVSTTTEFVQPSTVATIPATTILVAATPPVAATVLEAEVPPSTASPAGTAPETSAPTETAVPAATMPDAAAPPVVAVVPEVEVPPSTVSPAGVATETSAPVVAAVPEVLLRNGVFMVGWDLTVETAEVVDAAVEACSEVFETSIMAGCTTAVWEACYSMRADRGRLSGAVGPTNFEEPELNGAVNLAQILCSQAYDAEVVELAMVLAAKYGDRYYSEDMSLPFGEDPDYDLQDFENDYWGGGGDAGFIDFPESVKRDFIDFRMYLRRGARDPRALVDFGPFQFISDEAHVRVDPLFGTLGELLSAFSVSSSGPFEGFDAEKIVAFYAASGNDERVIDLPVDPEEVKVFCDEARYAARLRKLNWESDLNNCITATENCADTLEEDQNSMCGPGAKTSLAWNSLPRVCAAAEDIRAGDFDDSCRRAVLDLYLNHLGDPQAPVNDLERYTSLVFFLAQPLIADLAIEYRIISALPGA